MNGCARKNELNTVNKKLEIGSAQNIILNIMALWQCILVRAHISIVSLVFKKNIVDIFRIPPPPQKKKKRKIIFDIG